MRRLISLLIMCVALAGVAFAGDVPISHLPALTNSNVVGADMFPIVDTRTSPGVTSSMTMSQLDLRYSPLPVSLSTQVTSTLAIAHGGTGSTTATAAFDALSPLTTKGDVPVYNGTHNVRQAVGSNGQVLTADSTQTSGIKWATPAPGMGIGLPVSGGTAGSVLFVDGSTDLGQDNGNLFWDTTNHRLGISTTTPAKKLTIADTNDDDQLLLTNSSPTGRASFQWANDDGSKMIAAVYGSTNAINSFADTAVISSQGNNLNGLVMATDSEVATGGPTPFYVVTGGYNNGVSFSVSAGNPGFVGIGTLNPAAPFHVENGRWKTGQFPTLPTSTPTSNLNGGTCTLSHDTDVSGVVTLVLGLGSSSTGDVCDITFAVAYGVAPVCQLTAANFDVTDRLAYATSSTTQLNINFNAVLNGTHTYVLNYLCIETQ